MHKDTRNIHDLFIAADLNPRLYEDCHELLRSGADVHGTDREGGDNLFLLAAGCSVPTVELLKLLVDFGVDPLFINRRRQNALHALVAAETFFEPRVQVLKYIAKLGIDLDAKDICGESPLTLAIDNGLPQEVRALCELGARLDLFAPCLGDEWWSEDSTALESVVHRLVRSLRPQPEALQALIDHGAPLHFTDLLGQTPLEVAQGRLGPGPAPAPGTRREGLAKCVEILERAAPRR